MQHTDLINGLMQLNPKGGHFKHDPINGWPVQTPPIDNELHIWFEDDLTFYDNKVVEVEMLARIKLFISTYKSNL